MKAQKLIGISQELKTVLLDYLEKRPYKEVSSMVTVLKSAPVFDIVPEAPSVQNPSTPKEGKPNPGDAQPKQNKKK